MYDYKTAGNGSTFPSKNLDLLHPYVKSLVLKFLEEVKKSAILNGCEIKVTQTLRSIAYQNELYAQGRTKPGNKVTNAIGGSSMHNYGLAVDFGVFKDGKYLGGVNTQEETYYTECGRIAKQVGFFWGGDFTSIHDSGHIQYTGKFDNNTALSLLKTGKSADDITGVKS